MIYLIQDVDSYPLEDKMALTLKLSKDFEEQLEAEASERGVSASEYARRLLEEYLRRQRKQAEAVSQIESWIMDGDEAEQKETGEFLIQSLNQDRHATRPLFPSNLKGKTW
jgi:predicted transcriptional regulator